MLAPKEKVSNDFELILSSYLDLCDMQDFGMNIYWLDKDSVDSLYLIGYNNLSEHYTGFSMQKYLQLRIEEIFPNVLKYGIKQKYIDFIKNMQKNLTYRNIYNDNRIDHKEFQIRLLNLSNNYIGIIFQDISDQIRIKTELERMNSYYKSLFENMMEGVVVYDSTPDGQDFIIKDCNKSSELIENISKKNIIGKSVLQVFPNVQEFGLFEIFQNVNRTGKAEYFPIHFYNDERVQGWRENYVYKTQTGEIIAVYRDMTKQIEAEKNLTFPNQNPNPVLRVNKEGKVLYHNSASKSLLEYWEWDKNNKLSSEWIEIIQHIIKSKTIYNKEITFANKTYLLTLSPILGEQFLNIYGWDITKTRFLEQQLAQTQKMEAIGRLAGGIAHDFNNILTGLQAFTELSLEEPNLPEKVYDFLQQIIKASNSASKIIKQLLTFSRKQIFIPETINLNSVIESNIDFLKHIISENITINCDLYHDLWSILAEPNQIQQIIMNLIINSRDAIEKEGNINISTQNISIDKEEEDTYAKLTAGDYVLLTVSDTGVGMDKETLSHLFEPFFTTKGIGKGTGLGLSIVYSIVKQFEGFIIPSSDIGIGTTFKIYFPRDIHSVFEENERIERLRILKPIINGKILIVEDDEIVRNFITQLLGDNVFSTNTYVEAIQIAKKEKDEIKLLITDIIMPVMNGKQLASIITSINPNIKVLFISGYTQEIISLHESQEDLNYLSKPFTSKQLFDKIRTIFHQ